MKATGKKRYDVLVLGGGPGGYTAAFRAADLGLSVCLVEKRARLGGVCLNVGCIPSKTLLHGASLIEQAAAGPDYGIRFGTPQVDLGALLAKKEGVVEQLTSGLETLAKARKIDRFQGKGVFLDRNTLVVRGREGESEIQFGKAVIATGSSPFVLPALPDDPRIWDSTDALALQSIPKRFLIIGAGIIGLEMARIYRALGSEIFMVEMLDHIISPADKDLIQPLFLKLKKEYQIFTKSKVTAIRVAETGIIASFEGAKVPEQAEFDAVLVAVGRRPQCKDMGLEKLGIEIDLRGFIKVNEQQQTSLDNFYAVGDVVGEPMLAHKASHEAKIAAENIAGGAVSFHPKAIPFVAYTDPEVAWMGLTEKEARERKIEYSKGKFPWGASGRAQSTGVASGVTKVIFSKKTGRIIGAGICGAHAGELISEAVLALEKRATAHDIAGTIHAHPTLAETFALAAEIVTGTITDALPPRKR